MLPTGMTTNKPQGTYKAIGPSAFASTAPNNGPNPWSESQLAALRGYDSYSPGVGVVNGRFLPPPPVYKPNPMPTSRPLNLQQNKPNTAIPTPGPRGATTPKYNPNTGNYTPATNPNTPYYNNYDQSEFASMGQPPSPPQASGSSIFGGGQATQAPQTPAGNIFGGTGQAFGDIPGLPTQLGGGVDITGVGSIQSPNASQAYDSLLKLLGIQNTNYTNLGITGVQGNTARDVAGLNLQGTKYGAEQNTAQARIAAQGALAQEVERQKAAQASQRFREEQMPYFRSLISQMMPGSAGNQSLAAFSPQAEQGALNQAEAIVNRGREQGRQENEMQYGGSGFSPNSPQVMARNAAVDAASAGNLIGGQQGIRSQYGNDRGNMAVQQQNANTNAMNPIVALLSKLLG